MPQKLPHKSLRSLLPGLISAGIVFALCWLIFWLKDYAPFGTGILATQDAYIQYVDFFAYYRDLFTGKNSLLYTLSDTLGGDTLSLFSYYLGSPLNLLTLLFPKWEIFSAFHLLLSLKLSACAFTMAYFLKERFPKLSELFVVLLSLCYGLMQYNIAQSSNIMWLDGVYMLPLVILGVHRVFSQQKILLISVTAGLCILFTWYAAGIVCLFSIVWFAYEGALLLARGGKRKEFGCCLLRYAAGMVIAVLLSGILFLPSVYSQLATGKGLIPIGGMEDLGSDLLSVIRNYHLGGLSDLGSPSLFCGSLPLIGCIAYFFTGTIPRKQRLITLGLLGFMVAIYFWDPLYLLFSLLRYALSYYYRYSFITIFTIICIAACFYSAADKRTLKIALMCALGFLAVFLLLELTDRRITNSRLVGTVAAIAGCGGLLFLLGHFHRGKKLLSLLLAGLVCAELGMNAMLVNTGYHNYLDEFQWGYQEKQQSLIDSIRAEDPDIYRITQNVYRYALSFNESMAYGFASNTGYTSSPDNSQMEFLERLGYRAEADCMTIANTTVLAADSLLGTKYILSDRQIPGLQRLDRFGTVNGMAVYRNPYCLPMAFAVDSYTPAEETDDPFAYHEALFSALYGSKVSLYRPVEIHTQTQDHTVTYTLTLPQGNFALYGNIPFIYGGNYLLDVNGAYTAGYGGWRSMSAFYIPTQHGDLTATVSVGTDEYQQFGQPQFYALDLDALEKVTEALSQNVIAVDGLGTPAMSFRVERDASGYAFLSIPVAEGWRIRVNGKTVEPLALGDCLTVLPLEAGSNEISMDYHIPMLDMGIGCSVLGIGLLILWCFLEKRKNKGGC